MITTKELLGLASKPTEAPEPAEPDETLDPICKACGDRVSTHCADCLDCLDLHCETCGECSCDGCPECGECMSECECEPYYGGGE